MERSKYTNMISLDEDRESLEAQSATNVAHEDLQPTGDLEDASQQIRGETRELLKGAEVHTSTKEFVDEDGVPICKVELRYVNDLPGHMPRGCSQLVGLVLINPETEERIDLLDLIHTDVPLSGEGSIKVLIGKDGARFAYNSYNHRNKILITGNIDDPGGLAVLLHELGHAEQHHDEGGAYSRVAPLYIEHDDMLFMAGDFISKRRLDAYLDAIPDLNKATTCPNFQKYMQHLAELEKLEGYLDELESQKGEVWRELKKTRNPLKQRQLQREIRAMNRAIDVVYGLHADTQDACMSLGKKIGLSKVALLPNRLMERNANERAFEKMKEVKELIGVDLFKKFIRGEGEEKKILDAHTILKNGVEGGYHGARIENMTFSSADGDFSILSL